jgi:pimeloyl-ACP methyl ester carboxylesterase
MTTVEAGGVALRSFEVGGLVIGCSVGGSGAPVVVLHHSFGGVGWSELCSGLAGGCEVWAPDLPGFGGSSRPVWARDVRDLALLVGWWLRGLGVGPVTVVGCGFGGWVAAELVTMCPELFSGLVLVGSAGLLPEDGRILDQVLISHSEYVRAGFSSDAAYEAVFGAELSDEVLLEWDRCREMVARVAWKPYMYNRRLVPLLRLVEVPTLVVWGELDRVVPPECGVAFAGLVPGARLEVVAGCGHAVDLEAPEVLAGMVLGHVAAVAS